jgi:hypothetical protein
MVTSYYLIMDYAIFHLVFKFLIDGKVIQSPAFVLRSILHPCRPERIFLSIWVKAPEGVNLVILV